MEPLERRRDRCRRAVRTSRLVSLPLALEQFAAQEQGRQICRVDRQRALNRVFLPGLVAQILTDKGKTDPLLRVATIGVDQALECRAGGLHVSLGKSALSKRVQGSRML